MLHFILVTIDLLHEAAFGQHPDGTGLGNSLFARSDRVGSHSLHDITSFHEKHFVPGRVAFAVTGAGHSVDGLQLCEAMHEGVRLHPKQEEMVHKPKHTFVGGGFMDFEGVFEANFKKIILVFHPFWLCI